MPAPAETLAVTVDLNRHRLTPDALVAAIDPQFRRWPHIRLICLEIVLAVLDPDVRCIIITTQRQIGKSWAVRAVVIWLLEWFPTLTVGYLSYAAEISHLSARWIRNHFDTAGDLLCTRLAPDSKAVHRWNTVEGGGMIATGVDGSVTGTPLGVLVLDDMHKSWLEAQVENNREKAWRTFEIDAQGALSDHTYVAPDGTKTRIPQTVVALGTRYHEDDVNGRLGDYYEPHQIRRIHLPAIADPDAYGPDPLGRQPGQVVCEERQSQEAMLERRGRLDPVDWSTQYQGDPVAREGGLVDRGWWQWAERAPTREERRMLITSWDLTFKKPKSKAGKSKASQSKSWVVGQVWAATPSKKMPGLYEYILLDQVRRRTDYVGQRKMIRWTARAYPEAKWHLIEDKANGPAVISDLAQPWVDPETGQKWPPLSGVVPVETGTADKVTRMRHASPPIYDGRVFLPSWWEPNPARWPGDEGDDPNHLFPSTLITECAQLGQGALSDDEADACSQAINWLEDHLGHRGSAPVRSFDPQMPSTR